MNITVQSAIIHIIFLLSIFDIYFKSPVVRGIEADPTPRHAPAKRLVLFVADGLRSEAFHTACENFESPFLRIILETRGTWGVSHTRVPTETRPGHVAIIAGLYEDPSAVTKGWKENPVEFDTVFNQSRFTWSWGSPDILPMFAKGASGDHVFMDMYSSELEDFSGKDSTIHLDTWVFDKVEYFLKSAQNDSELFSKLHSDKIIFFLHLLGLDTAGHTHKPGSKEYKENVKAVDEGIKKMETLFETFYDHDGRTSYIFTADHGMTDWGSHGAGDASETETPLVAWGAGINTPHPSKEGVNKMDALRRDVSQADIAPLMATLIGTPLPVNSVGLLPKYYLNFTGSELSEAMFANARQMLAQYQTKRQAVEIGTLPFLYRPFLSLTKEKESEFLSQITESINEENFVAAVLLSEELLALSLAGLDYYQNYYQFLLLTCMTLSYLGWIAWLFCALIGEHKHNDQGLCSSLKFQLAHEKKSPGYDSFYQTQNNWFLKGNSKLNGIFISSIGTSLLLIYVQSLPFQFYIYCCLPQILWWSVLRWCDVLFNTIARTKQFYNAKCVVFLIFIYIIGIEVLVLSFFYRFVLSFGMLGVLCWPFYVEAQKHGNPVIMVGWIVSCIFLCVFPMLPVIGSQPKIQILLLSGVLWLIFAVWCTLYLRADSERSSEKYIWIILLLLLCVTVWNVQCVSSSLEEKKGLPVFNQALSWLLFGFATCLPLLTSLDTVARTTSIMIGLAVPFLLLSTMHEGLFLLVLSVNMLCWLYLEKCVSEQQGQRLQSRFQLYSADRKDFSSLSSSDFRRAFIFLFYIVLSFFGTGNIASLNSFDPTWVRCFVTVFSPFLMTALIIWKTVIPFLTVTCTFRAINITLGTSTEKLFFVVMMFSDAMGMHFLHLVTNQGSWLEIGTSISHFVIIHTMTLLIVVLSSIARCLTGTLLWPSFKISALGCKNSGNSVVELGDNSLESGSVSACGANSRNINDTFHRKKHVE